MAVIASRVNEQPSRYSSKVLHEYSVPLAYQERIYPVFVKSKKKSVLTAKKDTPKFRLKKETADILHSTFGPQY